MSRASAISLGIVVLAVAALWALGGCVVTRKGPDLTGDRTVEMYVRGADRMFVRYRVDRDGMLSFGGGLDAQQGEYTWTGPLTADEIDRLFAIIEHDRWFESNPVSTNTPPDRVYVIRLFRGGKRRRFEVRGESPSVSAAHELLDTAARRRNDEFLEALPQAGQQE